MSSVPGRSYTGTQEEACEGFAEAWLMVFPTVLGRGKRIFPDGIDRLKLKRAESK